ncbi:MAG TPA: cytochrome b [Bryobacterales bacterium]|nr:cytochrome b [Bryobacterales bacterium]
MSGHSSYEFKNPIARWIDSRLPILSMVRAQLVDFPTPRNLNYWWTFGGILATMLAIQLLTGIVLVMHYTPHADMAFDSVELIMRDVNYGWLLRWMHANGAAFFFLAVYIHMFRGIYYGSYKNPREILWMIGVVIFIVMMATAFMGYVLPWGQMSYWAAVVITNLFSAFPIIGDPLVKWLWGGFAVGNPTLQRFFSLHYLLPFILAALVVLHIWALHVTGNNNPDGIEVKKRQDTLPFHPYYTMKDLFAIVVFLMVYAAFVFYSPWYMGHSINFAPANPMSTPPHIVPEWYFLPFYAMLRAIPSKLGGVIVMFASLIILFFLPWLDTSKVKSAKYRPLYRQFFWLLLVVCFILGIAGSQPPEGAWLLTARLATAWYFIHFLVILPLLGFIEKPKPMPASISEAVLGGESREASAAT